MKINNALKVVIVAGAAALGGFLSRVVGGGWPKLLPLPAQWAYALPYGLIFWGDWWGLLAYVCAAVGTRVGHSQYFNLGFEAPGADESPVEPAVRLIFGPPVGWGGYWRSVFGLALVGIAATLVPGIIYAVKTNPLGGLLIAISGLFKPFAYMIGWYLRGRFGKPVQPNLIGEVGRGVGGYAVLAGVFVCFSLAA